MNKYLIIFLILGAISCRPGAGGADPETQDSLAVEGDSITLDTAGMDTLLLND